MVIQMARTFVAASWLNADENDYSGKQQSHMVGRMANLAAYSESERFNKAKKVREPDFRLTSERTIDRLEKHRADLDAAFESGKLSFERYGILLNEWEGKMSRAWKRHEKATGEVSQEVEQAAPIKPSIASDLINSVEGAAKSFATHHPFIFTVASILFGCAILNIAGIAG